MTDKDELRKRAEDAYFAVRQKHLDAQKLVRETHLNEIAAHKQYLRRLNEIDYGVNMKFEEWLEYGIEHDYCSPQFCDTHDGVPMLDDEVELFDSGTDICIHVVRLGYPQDWQLDANRYKENTQ